MKNWNTLYLALTITCSLFSQQIPKMRYEDRVRIREAILLSDQYGEQAWQGISKVPFAIVFVTDSIEFLIRHPNPSDDFTPIGYDEILKSEIWYRPRQFDKNLLATFPAVNGVNCIVVGTPENTGKNSIEWIITLLHEHFHQFQYTDPDYYNSVNRLELAGEDNTGMWMLNYPFPYEDEKIGEQYEKYVSALSQTVHSLKDPSFEEKQKTYLSERGRLKILLDSKDYKYFSFQLWQEGVARYTEFKFLQLMEDYEPSKEVSSLEDFQSFPEYKDELYSSQLLSLTELKLKNQQRVCFYANGFAEGLILDQLNPDWRELYLKDKFFLENYR